MAGFKKIFELRGFMKRRNGNVRFGGLQPEILWAMIIVMEVYRYYGLVARWTSVVDGKHGVKSYHRAGFACDFGLPTKFREGIVEEIREALGPEYDVVVESDHLHIEFDVRRQGEDNG